MLTKVPLVTGLFWVIKICATTLGETGGDALSMSLDLGYAVSSLIFLTYFAAALWVQLRVRSYHPAAYWATVVATTTVGTTVSDYMDRSLGLGYVTSSVLLLGGVLAVLALWRVVTGRIEFEDIASRPNEIFYWVTILVSNTLGTALGDFVADDVGLGFQLGTLVFAGLLGVVVLAYYGLGAPASLSFWAAYVLTRPLGATLGDTITKPLDEGGLDLGRIGASFFIAGLMVAVIWVAHRRDRVAHPVAPVRM